MSNRLEVLIFGASGFTAKYALIDAYRLFTNISWGVAGRNESKLKQALHQSAKAAGLNEFLNIPIVYANTEDEATIKKMTSQTKILINCSGPSDLCNGEVVVKCCIETGTHYIDMCAEDFFIADILIKYKKLAEEKGVYIVNFCGFNSIPFDLGVCFMEKEFEGTLNSAEFYVHSRRHDNTISGSSINYTTWISVVNAMAKHKQIKDLKKKLPVRKNLDLKPKLKIKLPHKVQDGIAVPFPGADEEVVRRSQNFFYEETGKRPVQISNYLVLDSYYYIFLTIVLGFFCIILSQFDLGRKILLKYPKFFSNGTFTNGSPSEDSLSNRQFSMTIKGKGWSNKLSKDIHGSKTLPDKEIVGRVSGYNPAYGVTGLCLIVSALVMAAEPTKLPARGGIYTPAAAFSKTSIIQQLQNNGLKFEITAIADLK